MTRNAMILILVCALAGVLFHFWQSDQYSQGQRVEEELERKAARGVVVFALRDILEGETIMSDAIEAREIDQSKIPQGVLGETAVAVGKKAKYGISKGQIVSPHDLTPMPSGYVTYEVKAVKEIRAGAVIKADAVKEIEIPPGWTNVKEFFSQSSMAIGKKAKYKITPGSILGPKDIMP